MMQVKRWSILLMMGVATCAEATRMPLRQGAMDSSVLEPTDRAAAPAVPASEAALLKSAISPHTAGPGLADSPEIASPEEEEDTDEQVAETNPSDSGRLFLFGVALILGATFCFVQADRTARHKGAQLRAD